MSRSILIIGVTGGAGRAVADAALDAGFRVRALMRHAPPADLDGRIGIARGDALSEADVLAAAEGADFVLHAANPPGYRDWERYVIPMAMNAAAAARAAGARLIVPGNVYNFSPDQGPLLREGAPQRPVSDKGRVRVRMERELRASGVRLTILRAGDFFGPHAPASWFQTVMVRPGRPVRAVTWPGTDAGHAFCYLPDFAEAVVRLMEIDDRLEPVEDLHFAGHHVARGRDFAEAVCRAAGMARPRVKRFPWWAVSIFWPVVPLFREIREMRYLWEIDIALDNSRLAALIGGEPHTPLDRALADSLAGQGCIPASAPWSARSATLFSG
jgi:nucleoside-diphosphate-sugar epimerase